MLIGIDVSKATLDIASHGAGAPWSVGNDASGVAQLLALFRCEDVCTAVEMRFSIRPCDWMIASAGLVQAKGVGAEVELPPQDRPRRGKTM